MPTVSRVKGWCTLFRGFEIYTDPVGGDGSELRIGKGDVIWMVTVTCHHGWIREAHQPAILDVKAEAFMENPLVIVAPPEHALAKQKKISLKHLQDEVFLVREPGSGTRSAMERFFTEREIQLKTGMEAGSNEVIKQGMQAGLGLGLLLRATIEQELELKRLVELDVAKLPIMRHWYVVHRHGKRLPAAAEAFKQFMLKEAHALINGTASSIPASLKK